MEIHILLEPRKKKQRNLLDELLGYVAYLISSYIGYIETQIKRDGHIFYHASLWEEFETRLWSNASIMDKNVEDTKFQIFSIADESLA